MRPLDQDFTITETLPTHRAVVVLRGRRQRDGLPVVLKHPAADIPTEAEIARLKYEHEVLCELEKAIASPQIVKPVELWGQGEKITLVLHDIGGLSLDHCIGPQALPIGELLVVAEKVLVALQHVHSAGILHKDINPRNIIYARDSKLVQIIDYGIAARTQQETSTTAKLAVEGTLDYAPPEQMGRVSRHADHRTDYYSLGAALYELACGELPFEAEDEAQLMHAILTQRPAPPHARNARVPPALSAVIMKLMEKSQEARYQSIAGIAADLRRVAALVAANPETPSALAAFELGTDDLDETFVLPQRLYGREGEMALLREAYAEAATRKRIVVFLEGPSGVGKSALAVDLHAEMLNRHGRFLAGKCDQLRRHLPFSALSQALSSMMRSILLEPPAVVDLWRRRIRAGLGRSAQALFEVVPSLEWLLGAHEIAPVMPSQQNDNRLHFLLQALVSTISAESSLVIFLDDLQWADTGTTQFLQDLAASTTETAGICVIAAYRNDELPPENAFAQLRRNLLEQSQCYDVQLAPLSLDSTCAFVADTTRQPRAVSDALGALVHQKTGGNPFFAREYLLYLRQQNHLKLEPGHRFWEWDLRAIDATPVTANVVALLTSKLQELPADVQQALSTAACLGNQFQLDALLDICRVPRDTLVSALSTSVLHGLLLANAADYRYAAHTQVDVSYKFAHDRVQQAAFGLLAPKAAAQVHWDIGQSMWARWREQSASVNIFDLLGHLNAAQALAVLLPERLALADLNLTGAKEAKRAAAHKIARDYLEASWQLLGEDPWAPNPKLARQVQIELMDCEVNAAQMDAALARLDTIVPHCADAIERAELDVRRVYTLSAANRNKDAVAAGLDGLKRLNYRFMGRSPLLLVFNALFTYWTLRKQGPDTVPRLPFTKNRRIEMIVEIMSGMSLPAYYVDQDIYALLSVRAPRLTLRYGLTRMSGYTVGAFGVAMVQLNDFAFGMRMAATSRAIIDTHATAAYRAAIEWVTTLYVEYLSVPLATIASQNQRAYEIGKLTGDPLFCGWSAATAPAIYLLASLRRVREGHEDSREYVTLLGERAQIITLTSIGCFLQLLTGEIDTTLYETAAYRASSRAEGATGHANDIIIRLIACWLWRDDVRTWASFLDCTKVDTFRSCVEYFAPYFSFYGALVLCDRVSRGERLTIKERLLFAKMRGKLRAVAKYGPRHFAGIDVLIQAQWLAARGRDSEAATLFDRAVSALDASELVGLRASAFECVGRFYMERGHPLAAAGYLNRSIELYRLWGATEKVNLLRREFAARLPAVASVPNEASDTLTSRREANASARHSTNAVAGMEMVPLRRLAHALNARSTREELAHEALACLNDATSATRSIIVLYIDGAPVHFDTARGVGRPEAILELTARTREILCIEDIAQDNELRNDTYVVQCHPKSVLCMPAMRGDEMLAMVYLENTTMAGVFTPARVRLLELLVPQIAMAFENRMLAADMDKRVQAALDRIKGTSERQLILEKERTEARMAGGFAHEMRNALSSVGYVMPVLLPTEEFGDVETSGAESIDVATKRHLERLREQPTHEEVRRVVDALTDHQAVLRTSLESIARAIQRGLKITDQVMEYAQASRIIAGAQSVHLDKLVRQIVEEHQKSLDALGIACKVQIGPGVVCHMGEPHAYAVIRNLIANARDALSLTRDGRARRIDVTATPHAGGIRLDVVDNGPGMAPEQQKHTFEPFFTTKGSQGSGLGLGLSRKILAAYGGQIEFKTEVDMGTTFTVDLPN